METLSPTWTQPSSVDFTDPLHNHSVFLSLFYSIEEPKFHQLLFLFAQSVTRACMLLPCGATYDFPEFLELFLCLHHFWKFFNLKRNPIFHNSTCYLAVAFWWPGYLCSNHWSFFQDLTELCLCSHFGFISPWILVLAGMPHFEVLRYFPAFWCRGFWISDPRIYFLHQSALIALRFVLTVAQTYDPRTQKYPFRRPSDHFRSSKWFLRFSFRLRLD